MRTHRDHPAVALTAYLRNCLKITLQMTFRFPFVLILLFSFLFVGCDGDADDTPVVTLETISNFTGVPAYNLLQDFEFNFVTGTDPTDLLVGGYLIDDMELLATTVVGDEPVGTEFLETRINFSNPNPANRTLTVSVEDTELGGATTDAYYTVSGDQFNVFAKVASIPGGIPVQTLYSFSGELRAEGIQDIRFSLIVLDDGGNPNNNNIAQGEGRLFIDVDGLAERQ